MKQKLKLIGYLSFAFLSLTFILSGCKKQQIQKPNTANLNEASSEDVSFSKVDGNTKLTLRPGPDNGQDAYTDKEAGVQSNNVNYVPELCANSWTISGNLYASAIYIRFDSLALVAASSHIVNAKLYLYGLSNSLSTPQGDQGDNACYVNRIISTWEETTLTAKNRPTFSADDAAILAPSTSQWNYNAVVDVTALVSYFVTHPSENYGFYIHQITQSPYRSMVFGSSEQSDKKLRPKLVVTYQ